MKTRLAAHLILITCVTIALSSCSKNTKQPEVNSLDTHPYKDYVHEMKASEILPSSLKDQLKGDTYTVDETVTNIAGMNRFSITSDFGELTVDSNYLLQKRIDEFTAIAELHEISRGEALLDSQVDAVKASVDVTVDTIVHPINTAKKIPGGVLRLFTDSYKDIKGAVNLVSGEEKVDDVVGEGIGTANANRGIAKEYKVDPYSRNHLLQNEMNRLALFMATGKKAEEYTRKITEGKKVETDDTNILIWDYKYRDLKERNKSMLLNSGTGEEVVNLFLTNPNYITSEITSFVTIVANLSNTGGVSRFIEVAAHARTVDEAVFYLQSAKVLGHLHEKMGGMLEIKFVQLVPVVVTNDNQLIIVSPIDYATFYTQDRQILEKFIESSKDFSPSGMELWITGLFAKDVEEELTKKGIVPVSQVWKIL